MLLSKATYSIFRLYIFLSVCVFPGNWTHNLYAANAMLYHWATGIIAQPYSKICILLIFIYSCYICTDVIDFFYCRTETLLLVTFVTLFQCISINISKKTKHVGPYFNNLSAWCKACRCTQGVSESTFASLMTGKQSAYPGAWSKRVVPILLMSNVFWGGITCNKPESHLPFPLRASCGGFAI